jgi:hypothetical protein
MMSAYQITEETAHEAAMAAHAASDLAKALAQVADGPWLSPSQHSLRAEWAMADYDKLVERMAKIPRPVPRPAVVEGDA